MLMSEAKQHITVEWSRWLRGQETTNFNVNMPLFWAALSKHRPDLLSFKCRGDKWAVVKGWIQN